MQGGLHHLHKLPDDLERVLAEARRVLRRDGRLVVVEPWLTPFLSLAHFVCALRPAHLLSRKVWALATMIEHERDTAAKPGDTVPDGNVNVQICSQRIFP